MAQLTLPRLREPSVHPGFRAGARLRRRGPQPDRADPARGPRAARRLASVRPSSGASSAMPRTLAALRLSFGASLHRGAGQRGFRPALAWVLVRYRFPGRRIIDAAVDLPFALPTAVAGIALTALYAPNGLIGSIAGDFGLKIAYHAAGHRDRADLRRPALRGPHRAAGDRRDRTRDRGGRRPARRQPPAHRLPGGPAACLSRPCSPALRWPSRAASANTAR